MLITMCGLPSSGKTECVSKMIEDFTRIMNENEKETLKREIIHINDEGMHLDKCKAYQSPTDEKKTRAVLMSAVERNISKDNIVILDAMNYIKGYRYQLHCIAKSVGTHHCVVHCSVPAHIAKQWNQNRSNGYNELLFDDLASRFEEPNDRQRWDSPLFIVHTFENQIVPSQDIWNAISKEKPNARLQSTVTKPLLHTNYMYDLDQMTQNIIQQIISFQTLHCERPHDRISSIPIELDKEKYTVSFKKQVTLSDLMQLRRQFQIMQKLNTVTNKKRLQTLFVDYLNQSAAAV